MLWPCDKPRGAVAQDLARAPTEPKEPPESDLVERPEPQAADTTARQAERPDAPQQTQPCKGGEAGGMNVPQRIVLCVGGLVLAGRLLFPHVQFGRPGDVTGLVSHCLAVIVLTCLGFMVCGWVTLNRRQWAAAIPGLCLLALSVVFPFWQTRFGDWWWGQPIWAPPDDYRGWEVNWLWVYLQCAAVVIVTVVIAAALTAPRSRGSGRGRSPMA